MQITRAFVATTFISKEIAPIFKFVFNVKSVRANFAKGLTSIIVVIVKIIMSGMAARTDNIIWNFRGFNKFDGFTGRGVNIINDFHKIV